MKKIEDRSSLEKTSRGSSLQNGSNPLPNWNLFIFFELNEQIPGFLI
jgi:hypothetical protein